MVDSENTKPVKGIQLIANQSVKFANPLTDVQVAILPIAGCAWIDTGDGIVVIDTLIGEAPAREMFDRIEGQIKYIIYTHGHLDHVGDDRGLLRATRDGLRALRRGVQR